MKIVGVGYGFDGNIGESWLQINTLNMWDFLPKGHFPLYSIGGGISYLTKNTRTSDKSYKQEPISIEELTDDNLKELIERGYKF